MNFGGPPSVKNTLPVTLSSPVFSVIASA
jgi:hypothetical protein